LVPERRGPHAERTARGVLPSRRGQQRDLRRSRERSRDRDALDPVAARCRRRRPARARGDRCTVMRTMTSLRLAVATLLVPVALHAQEPVRPADYARFESPGTATLSPDGRWLAYGVNRVDEQNELRVRLLTRDSTIVIRFGSGATFSGDSRWLVHSVG